MIGMSPAKAELPGWAYCIRRKQELHYSKIKRKKPKYKIGQTVRIGLMKGKFDRGFTPQFKEEIFKIKSISTRLPKPTYELETLEQDETLEGNFYEIELMPVDEPELFVIEKVLRSKKDEETGEKMVLVKWKGYKNPSWAYEKDVVDVSQ